MMQGPAVVGGAAGGERRQGEAPRECSSHARAPRGLDRAAPALLGGFVALGLGARVVVRRTEEVDGDTVVSNVASDALGALTGLTQADAGVATSATATSASFTSSTCP